jgi:hypothetical protein
MIEVHLISVKILIVQMNKLAMLPLSRETKISNSTCKVINNRTRKGMLFIWETHEQGTILTVE